MTLMKTSSLQLLGASAICPCTHRHSLLFNPQKAIEAFAFYSCAIMSHIRRFLMALFKKKKKEGGEERGGGGCSFVRIPRAIRLHTPQPSNRRREAVPGGGT